MSENTITNVLVVGVGGQGILLAGELLARVALNAGLDVKKSEIHGMAQRGGSVNSQVRFGALVPSPVVPEGETHVLLAFEKLEPLRWLPFCGKDTVAIVNDHTIHSLTTATSLETYPANVEEELRARFSRVTMVPGLAIARELGNPRVVNVLLLGLLAKSLSFPKDAWIQALSQRLPPKLLEVNLAAFERGYGLLQGASA